MLCAIGAERRFKLPSKRKQIQERMGVSQSMVSFENGDEDDGHPLVDVSGGKSESSSSNVILQLTPAQSCGLHGWTNPKRTLSWEDVARGRHITFGKCVEQVSFPLLYL